MFSVHRDECVGSNRFLIRYYLHCDFVKIPFVYARTYVRVFINMYVMVIYLDYYSFY